MNSPQPMPWMAIRSLQTLLYLRPRVPLSTRAESILSNPSPFYTFLGGSGSVSVSGSGDDSPGEGSPEKGSQEWFYNRKSLFSSSPSLSGSVSGSISGSGALRLRTSKMVLPWRPVTWPYWSLSSHTPPGIPLTTTTENSHTDTKPAFTYYFHG